MAVINPPERKLTKRISVHCETRFMFYFMKKVLKRGIFIDADSGPLGYVL